MILIALIFVISLSSSIEKPSQNISGKQREENIKIKICLKPNQLKDSGKIVFAPVDYILYQPVAEIKKPFNGLLTITKKIDRPQFFMFSNLLLIDKLGVYFVEPGDDLSVVTDGGGFQFMGRGTEKYRLQYQIDSIDKSFPAVNNKRGAASFSIDSVGEFLQFRRQYEQKVNAVLLMMNRYKKKVSSYAFQVIKNKYIKEKIGDLKSKFHGLHEHMQVLKMPMENLSSIYDTAYYKTLNKWVQYLNEDEADLFLHDQYELYRQVSFDRQRFPSETERRFLFYDRALKSFSGASREKYIVSALPEIMLKVGFSPETEQRLKAYYAETGFSEWKKWMAEKELEYRRLHSNYSAPDFALIDSEGKKITKSNLRNKTAILNFQSNDHSENEKALSILEKVEKEFKDRDDIYIVNISPEKWNKKWVKSIHKNRFSSPNTKTVYSISQETDEVLYRRYAINKLPSIWVLGPDGKTLDTEELRQEFLDDDGETLISFINEKLNYFHALEIKMLAYKKDGPYVFHNGKLDISYSISDSILTEINIARDKPQELLVNTDLNDPFKIKLQVQLSIPPVEYVRPEKLLALSDIEGNFDAFRKLLQQNKVIDQDYNWIFGNGHLVFAGDMFDRGEQVTECLWLIYSLEEKAKAAGGYVHFVLGNHEIMNMQGNHSYTRNKYQKSAKLIGKSLTALYNQDSELGRWLRTKNIIEKIGDLLFVHGGISPEVNRLSLTIEEINKMARPFFDKIIDSTNSALLAIYDSRTGENYRISPFWSRGYYKGNKLNVSQVDSTCSMFNVQHIITGHTIVADTISVHYKGKVINIDVHHAEGKSEALFIQGNHFYRVDAKGNKVLLLINDIRRKTGDSNFVSRF